MSKIFGENEVISEVDMYDEFSRNFIDYAATVNLQRAFPHVADGLKPSQRRAIFAMWESGLKPGNMSKSAKAVSATMGDFHPHGDCLDYDTMFISADGSGNKTIGELYDSGVDTFQVYSWDGEGLVSATAHSFRVGQVATQKYVINLTNEASITCTANHPILTTQGWLKAEDIHSRMEDGEHVYLWHQVGSTMDNPLSVDPTPICGVDIIDCEPTPMYDFTVDEHENAVIHIGSLGGVMDRMVCVHNSSIYETIVRMQQGFKMRVPLVDGRGGWGTFSNPVASAMRYTECSLNKEALLILGVHPWTPSKRAEVNENVVRMVANYDGSKVEPVIMPSLFPNLVINGFKGLGQGVAGSLPQHDPTQVMDLALHMVDSPNPRVSTVISKLPGPDIPTKCQIFDDDGGIESYLTTGVGSYIMRGEHHIEKNGKNKSIVFTSLPYESNPEKVINAIREMVDNGTLPPNITADDETKKDVRIVVNCKNNDVDVVFNTLCYYSNVGIQQKHTVNNLVFTGKRLKTMSVVECLQEWLDHRRKVITTRSINRKAKAEKRLHIVDGFIKMVPIAEKILVLVRSSKNRSDALDRMVKDMGFSQEQADSILSMNISQLTKVSISDFDDEKKDLEANISELDSIINDHDVLQDVLKKEIREARKMLNGGRKSTIMEGSASVAKPDLTAFEDAISGYLAVSRDNWVRWVSRPNINFDLNGDYVSSLVSTDSLKPIVVVTSKGKAALLDADSLMKNNKNFSNVKLMLTTMSGEKLEPGEKIVNVFSALNDSDLIVFTKHGEVKRLPYDKFSTKKKGQVFWVSTVKKGDEIISASQVSGSEHFIGVSSDGKMVRVPSSEVAARMGNKAGTMMFQKLTKGQKIVAAFPESEYIVYGVHASHGDKLAKVKSEDIPIANKGVQGKVCVKPSDLIVTAIPSGKEGTIVYGKDDFEQIPLSDIAEGIVLTPKRMTEAKSLQAGIMATE